MPRKPRQFIDGGYYHLIARGNNRLFIFEVDGGYEFFKELLRRSKVRYRWQLSHYCLMANHFHLLGQVERGGDLSRLMQYLLFEYSRWYRKKRAYVGHLWQGRYKGLLIEKESYFLECGRYIERNPVRAGLVKDAAAYRWSSYRYYGCGETDPLVDEDPYYSELGMNAEVRQKRYRDFVKMEGPYDNVSEADLLESHF